MAAENNPYYVAPASPLTALMAGVSGYDRAAKSRKEAETLAGRQEAMSALQSGGDTRGALAKLIGVGDVQGANAIAQYAEQQANRGFRESEAQRAQRNADRSYGLQERQFGLAQRTAAEAARGFEIREVDDGQGGKMLVRVQKATGQAERLPVSGADTGGGGNPYAPGGKPTEGQANAALYANRLFEAEGILRDPKVVNAATSVVQRGLANPIPYFGGRSVGNFLVSEDYQKFDQAQRNFINATLRRESGAVISDDEFANARIQYFPQPGDTKAVLEQKKRNRADAIRGIAGGGGPGYQPPQLFDETGNLVPNTRARNATPPSGPPAGLRRVNSPEEAARLPKGTRFIDPNGVERVVP